MLDVCDALRDREKEWEKKIQRDKKDRKRERERSIPSAQLNTSDIFLLEEFK